MDLQDLLAAFSDDDDWLGLDEDRRRGRRRRARARGGGATGQPWPRRRRHRRAAARELAGRSRVRRRRATTSSTRSRVPTRCCTAVAPRVPRRGGRRASTASSCLPTARTPSPDGGDRRQDRTRAGPPRRRRRAAPVHRRPSCSTTALPTDPLQVVHAHDVERVLVRALLDADLPAGRVDVAAAGHTTVRAIAAAVGRRVVEAPGRCGRIVAGPTVTAPTLDTTGLRDDWGFTPTFDVAQASRTSRSRAAAASPSGGTVHDIPWRLPRVLRDPGRRRARRRRRRAGARGPPAHVTGEFDTPIDPALPRVHRHQPVRGAGRPVLAVVGVGDGARHARSGTGHLRAAAPRRGRAARDVGPDHRRVRPPAVRGHHDRPLHGAHRAVHRPRAGPLRVLRPHRGRPRAVRRTPAARRAPRPRPPTPRRADLRQLPGRPVRRVATATPGLRPPTSQRAGGGRRRPRRPRRPPAARADPAGPRPRRARLGARVGVDPAVRRLRRDPAAAVRSRRACPRRAPSWSARRRSARCTGWPPRRGAIPSPPALLSEPETDAATLAAQAPAFSAALAAELALIGHRGPGEVEMRCADLRRRPRPADPDGRPRR